MKYLIPLLFVLPVLLALLAAPPSLACNVCHSKNPKMVRMHEQLEFKDCFKCHFNGSLKKGEEMEVMMQNDERCVRCHKK